MAAFTAAKQGFVVHLRPDDVAEDLPEHALEEVADALGQLVSWGNLRADPDTGRVVTVDDFNRPRYLYQLTPAGEAAEIALAAFDAALGRRGELQAVALEDIRVRLHRLRDLAGHNQLAGHDQLARHDHPDAAVVHPGAAVVHPGAVVHPDAAVVHSLLRELTGLLDGLAGNASAFMSSLQRTIDLQDVDEAAFLAYKDRLLGYLDRFIGELVVKSAEIARTLREIDELAPDRLLRAAAEREALDAVPGPGQADPAAAALVRWRARWAGLHSWFVGDRTHPSQATLLRQRARAAIPALLATVGALQDRHAGRSDRSADFRALARWFAQAGSDADAHRLWRAAFGLTSARHLTVDAATVTEWERRQLPGTTPWREAPPLEISPRLRATGKHQKRGAPARIRDRRQAREALAEQLAAESAGLAAIRTRLATGKPTRLSALGPLSRGEFDLLLTLLGDALAAGPPGAGPPGVGGELHAVTADGSLEILLVPATGGERAEIVTPDGVLRGPDHLVTIVDRTASEAYRTASEAHRAASGAYRAASEATAS